MTRKSAQHETPSQAHTFTVYNNAALEAGYCHTCAAQHAYGRQHGWRQVHPPCPACAPLARRHTPRWAGATVTTTERSVTREHEQ